MRETIKVREKLSVTLASESDWDDIVSLQRKIYPHHGWSKEYLNWQYAQNPAGGAQVWIARLGKEIVGCYAAAPHAVLMNGQRRIGWRMEHLLTRPEHRRLGIFHSFANLSRKFLSNPKFGFSFAFPNERSHKGFIASGWQVVFEIPLYSMLLKNIAIPKIPAPFLVTPVLRFDSQSDLTWRAYSHHFNFMIDRSSKYLNWRYIDCPHIAYEKCKISGEGDAAYLLLKTYVNSEGLRWAHICDYFQQGDNLQCAKAAFIQAIRYAEANKCIGLSLWCALHCPFQNTIAAFPFKSQNLNQWFVIFTPPNLSVSVGPKNSVRWNLMMGDTDVF